MTALDKIRGFIRQYPGADVFRDFHVDYTDQIPDNGGVFPSGLTEVSRTRDILGNVTTVNQYNFGLYYLGYPTQRFLYLRLIILQPQ